MSGKLTAGLKRSASRLTGYVGSLWQRKAFDSASLEELESALLSANLGVPFTETLMGRLNKARSDAGTLQEQLAKTLEDYLVPHMQGLPEFVKGQGVSVCMLVGVNGAGKTTTAGKLAQWYRAQGYEVGFVNADLFRAAALEQSQTWATRSGVTFYGGAHKDSAALVYEAYGTAKKDGKDILIVDTAGRLHTQKNLMDELEKITRVLRKHKETAPEACLLVLDGTVGQNALSQASLFQKAAPLTGLVVTKLDGTSKAGIVVPLVDAVKVPIVGLGVGEGPGDLQAPDPRSFARSLTGLDDTE